VNTTLENLNPFRTKLSWLQLNRMPSFAVIGACFYIASLGMPFQFKLDIPLLILSLFSVLMVFSSNERIRITKLPLVLLVSVFIVTTGISILFSQDISRSMKLSVSLLPTLLIFSLIVIHFKGIKDIRSICIALSGTVLWLSFMLIWDMSINGKMDPFLSVSDIGSPILVVKNDVTFLSLVAPISLSLLYSKPGVITRIIAGLSVFLSIIVIGFFQSRVAMLTIIVSITCFFTLIQPKKGLISCIGTLIAILLIDGIMGSPLIERFVQYWDGTGRIPLWLSAWKMFLDAPLLGQGPHTFVLFYNSYLQNISLPPWLFVDHRIVPWAHNLYLEVLAEQGLIGFSALVLLLVRGLFIAWNLRQAKSHEIRIMGYGVFAALGGFCFAAATELTFLRQWVLIMMFTLLGLITHLSFQTDKKELA